MCEEKILILDFGSQYTQLIARRVRELNVYSEIQPFDKEIILHKNIKGIILSGSPYSVNQDDSPDINLEKFRGKVPILGLCFGAQLIASKLGCNVVSSKSREYGRANLSFVDENNILMESISKKSQVWMSHGDTIMQKLDCFEVIASTKNVEIAGFQIKGELSFALQFHPEVYHSTEGSTIIKNFLTKICSCSQIWNSDSYVRNKIKELKSKIGKKRVVLGLSGGVDSTVSAILLNKAIGKNLYCIFVDNGLLRKNEFAEVLKQYKGMGLNVKGVDAKNTFIDSLNGVVEPEEKRKIIGKLFIEIFDKESSLIKDVSFLAQGTIYPDVIESISANGGPSATIKSHHNVGGLPDYMKLEIIEPLRNLFKDEVRRIGKSLNIHTGLLSRHPFPGPGLAIRILGSVDHSKVKILQEADYIFISALKNKKLYDDIWQAGVILLPVKSVGVMGDERTYENTVVLRAVSSTDGMTADWVHLPYEFLASVSNEIINKVKGINRVVYDISSKPPSTIEWE